MCYGLFVGVVGMSILAMFEQIILGGVIIGTNLTAMPSNTYHTRKGRHKI